MQKSEFNFTTEPSDYIENQCAYIPEFDSKTEYKILLTPEKQEAEAMLALGWRRFGTMFFRPVCEGCSACIPLKVSVNDFKFTKSYRKVLNKNANITVVKAKPSFSEEKLDLHNLYHQYQAKKKGWPWHAISSLEYKILFCTPFEFAYEFQYYLDHKLIGIGYVDIFDKSFSSIYFFYNPEWQDFSPGTFSILNEITYCTNNQITDYHLGYWVEQCPSMQYKKRFKPHSLLKGQSEDWSWEDATWSEFTH